MPDITGEADMSEKPEMPGTADMPDMTGAIKSNANNTTAKPRKTSLKSTKWKSSRRHSISAIAEDGNGNILFYIHKHQ